MKFPSTLLEGNILKRYKRFLCDVRLKGDQLITSHIANPGSMKTCWQPNWKVLLSYHNNPKRKLKYSVEMINNNKTWIGVNTSIANKLAIEAIDNGTIKELQGYKNIRPEVKIGNSRIDILLTKNQQKCFVEVKSVTMISNNSLATFPDTITERGTKHLKELIKIKKDSYRAVMLYIVQREDVSKFTPAWEIDPNYSKNLKAAFKKGVEILVYQCKLSPKEIKVYKKLDWYIQ